MATEGRTMPEWAHAAAVRQALYAQRDWMGGFGRVLWRRKLPVLACVGLVLASTAAYVSALTPVYQAEALVAWDNLPDQQPGSSRAAQDPLRLSASRAMAERLVDRLDLQLLPEFHPDTPSRGLRRTALTAIRPWLPSALVHWLAEGSVDTRPAERALTDEQRATRLRDAVIEAAMARMRAEMTDSSAIGLKFVSEDPQIAAAGANALADLYLEQRPARRDAATPGKREQPDQETERLRADIRATEQAIAAARAGTDAQASGASAQSRLDRTGELAFWRRERAEVEARLRKAQAALEAGADFAPDLQSERLGQLQRRAIELEQALAALSQEAGEQDPQLVDLRAQQAALEQDRRAELEQSLKKLRDERGIIEARETELEREDEGSRG